MRAPAAKRRLGVVAVLSSLLGCLGSSRDDPERLMVLSASVFIDALPEAARGFEARYPGTTVSFGFAGSQVLRHQLEHGAVADVFLSGHLEHLQALEQSGLVRDRRVLAHNHLTVIVPLDNPAAMGSFADLGRARRLVIGEAGTPVGRYTKELLGRAAELYGDAFVEEVLRAVVSKESNVRLVRAKVELGDADAAIVYRTDALSSERVREVPIPRDLDVRADYHAGLVSGSSKELLARRWLDYLTLGPGRATLEKHGFQAPSASP